MNLRTIPNDQLAAQAVAVIEEMYRRLGGNFDANTDEALTGAIDAISEAGSAFEAQRSFNEPIWVAVEKMPAWAIAGVL